MCGLLVVNCLGYTKQSAKKWGWKSVWTFYWSASSTQKHLFCPLRVSRMNYRCLYNAPFICGVNINCVKLILAGNHFLWVYVEHVLWNSFLTQHSVHGSPDCSQQLQKYHYVGRKVCNLEILQFMFWKFSYFYYEIVLIVKF